METSNNRGNSQNQGNRNDQSMNERNENQRLSGSEGRGEMENETGRMDQSGNNGGRGLEGESYQRGQSEEGIGNEGLGTQQSEETDMGYTPDDEQEGRDAAGQGRNL